jgi:hypothetical protein
MTTTPTAPATLNDVKGHPLCRVVYSADESDSPHRYHFTNGYYEEYATDADVVHIASLFISDGLPFTLTVSEYNP